MDILELFAENLETGTTIVATADPALMPEELRELVVAHRDIGDQALAGAVMVVVEAALATGRPLAELAEEVCRRSDGSPPFMTMSVLEA